MSGPQINVVRQAFGGGRWETASRAPAPALREHVLRYQGYVERWPDAQRRYHYPVPWMPVVVTLGPPLRVESCGALTATGVAHDAFVSGLMDYTAASEFDGMQRGVQVDFSPTGAYRFFGLPMGLLGNRVVELEDALGAEAKRLRERLYEAPDWGCRFDLLDDFIASRFAATDGAPGGIEEAWRRLMSVGGATPINRLAEDVGWGRRRLAAGFREYVGLTPKTAARVIRFARALRLAESGADVRWSDVAYECGYYDQAHLIREFNDFTGRPPGDFLARRLPKGGGVRAE